MKSLRRMLMLAGALSTLLAASAACAADNKVVIGDIDDMSGPYADVIGAGGVEAIKMAIADFGGSGARPADRGSDLRSSEQAGSRSAETPRMGRHRRLTMLLGGSNTGRQPGDVRRGQGEEDPLLRHRRGRRLADRQGLHALYDPLRLRHDRARQRHRQDDPRSRAARAGSSSPPITPSASNWRRAPRKSSRRAGEPWSATFGCPLGTSDFSSYLLQAQGSGAQVLGLANAGADTSNSLKAAAEFGLTKTMRPAALLGVLHRRPCDRARNRAGPRADNLLVLEPRTTRRGNSPTGSSRRRRRCRPSRRPPSIRRRSPI